MVLRDRKEMSFMQRIVSTKCWRSTGLAAKVDQIWHSLPLVGVEQRYGSAALTVGYVGQGGTRCACRV